jgi:hypothetical protein
VILSLAAFFLATAGPAPADEDVAAKTKARLSEAIESLTADNAEYGLRCARYVDVRIDLSRGDLTETEVACEHARHRRATGVELPPDWSGAPTEMPKASPPSESPR